MVLHCWVPASPQSGNHHILAEHWGAEVLSATGACIGKYFDTLQIIFRLFPGIIATYHEMNLKPFLHIMRACYESRIPPGWVGNNKVRIVVLGCCLPCHVGFQFAMLAGVKLPCPLSQLRRGVCTTHTAPPSLLLYFKTSLQEHGIDE